MGKECSTLKSYAGENKERYIEYLKEKANKYVNEVGHEDYC